MEKKHCADLLAGYALGALDDEERATAERHIMNCPACRAEYTEIRETLHLCLGHTVPLAKPSPLRRTQFLAQLALEMNPMQAGSVPGRPVQPRTPLLTLQPPLASASRAGGAQALAARQRYRLVLGGATVPALLAIVLGMLFMQSQSQLNDTRDHILAEAFAVPHIAMPMSGVATSHGMRGEVIMPKSGMSGMVIISGMTDVPAGMRFTCWVREHGRWIASGVLKPNSSGIAMMAFGKNMDLHQADNVAVTMERTPHPVAPAGPMLLSSTL
jgi:hypothetical protein